MKEYRVEYLICNKLAHKDYDKFGDALEKVAQLYQAIDKHSCWAKEDYRVIKILQWDEQTGRYVNIK